MDPLFSLLPYILYVIPYVTALLLALIAGKFSVSCTRKKRVISTLLAFSIGLLAFFPWKNYKITALQERVVSHLSEDSIIKEYPLILKKYPHAYNPSLIPYKEGFLLSFRVKSYDFPSFLRKVFNVRTSYIGLVELDKDCKPSSTPYLLSLYSYEGSSISHSAQDARLFYKGKDIYLLFNDYGKSFHRSSYALYLTKLEEKAGLLCAHKKAIPLLYPGMRDIEKNWTPLVDSKEELYLVYSFAPYQLLHVNIETGICKTLSTQNIPLSWDGGEIRGGTPFIRTETGFLTFFHSSFPSSAWTFFGVKTGRNMVQGALLVEKEYPFSPLSISSSYIGTEKAYKHNNRRKVIFPGGLVEKKDILYLAWGKNDNQLWITLLDKAKLEQEMSSIFFSQEKN